MVMKLVSIILCKGEWRWRLVLVGCRLKRKCHRIGCDAEVSEDWISKKKKKVCYATQRERQILRKMEKVLKKNFFCSRIWSFFYGTGFYGGPTIYFWLTKIWNLDTPNVEYLSLYQFSINFHTAILFISWTYSIFSLHICSINQDSTQFKITYSARKIFKPVVLIDFMLLTSCSFFVFFS